MKKMHEYDLNDRYGDRTKNILSMSFDMTTRSMWFITTLTILVFWHSLKLILYCNTITQSETPDQGQAPSCEAETRSCY